MAETIQLVEQCCLEVVATSDDSPPRRLGFIVTARGGWEAWSVSPYDSASIRRVGRALPNRLAAERLVIACTRPYLAKRGGS